MQVSTKIPPISYQNYPVNIHIRIRRIGARYEADIFAAGQGKRVTLDISPEDLLTMNKQFQKILDDTVYDCIEDWTFKFDKIKEQLRPLAEMGHYAFKKVFGHLNISALLKKLLITSNVYIQIASEDFILPWELIYPVSLEESLSYEHFWGMKYIISRIIIQQDCPGAFVSPEILISSLPKLGLLTYDSLLSIIEKEIPYFEELASNGKIILFKLHSLNPEKKQEGLLEFRNFWEKDLNIGHFACHAFYEDNSPNLSHILLSDEFPVTIMDMEIYNIIIKNYPLVILNACKTGNLNPLYTSNFVASFLKCGARGVVASEYVIPDNFAADFVEHFYSYFLKGQFLGESLLNTRLHFLKKYQNPLGLLYSMYAPPSIRLIHYGE